MALSLVVITGLLDSRRRKYDEYLQKNWTNISIEDRKEENKNTERPVGLQYHALQPHLAAETDVKSNI